MTPIELSTRRRVTGLTSDEFARLFVSLQREVDGEAAHWSATDVESWELVGPPVTAEQHLIDTFAAANEFVATLADRLYTRLCQSRKNRSSPHTLMTSHSGHRIRTLAECRAHYGTSPHCRRPNGPARKPASPVNWTCANRWCDS